MEIQAFYERFASQLHLVGDQPLHHEAIQRLRHWGITLCQVLANLTEAEIVCIWSRQITDPDTLIGPGVARSFVSQLRQLAQYHVNQPYISSLHSAESPGLVGALESLASATQKLKRKRKPYDHDIDSSEDEVVFDLGSVLDAYQSKPGYLRSISSSSFGDLKRLYQLSHKANRRLDIKVPFMAQSSIEDWNPTWIGADLSKDRKSTLIKTRSKDLGSKGFASFLSNITTFLLSHLAIKQIETPTIIAYLAILCKLAEERGSSFSIRYRNLLHSQILDKIRSSERFSLNDQFSTEQDSIIRKIESRPSPAQLTIQKSDFDSDKGRIRWEPIKTRIPDKLIRKLVCLKHRPHENLRCLDPECLRTKEHLDTTKPDQLFRYQRASQAADARKSKTSSLRNR